MIKKIILLLFLCGFSNNIISQTVTVTYKERKIVSKEKLEALPEFVRNKTLKDLENPPGYILMYSNGISLYKNDEATKNTDSSEKKSSEKREEDSDVVEVKEENFRITDKSNEKTYYKDFSNNLLMFKLTNAGKEYDGKDHLLKWDWEITQDTKTINGYLCKKAITHAYGMNFTAWFTEDIPINAGPEKFDGLPGLIVYIGNNYIELVAEKIKTDNTKLQLQQPELSKKTFTILEMYDDAKRGISKSGTTVKTEGSSSTTTTRQVFH